EDLEGAHRGAGGRDLPAPARDRVRPRLRHRAREVSPARPRPSAANLFAPHAREAHVVTRLQTRGFLVSLFVVGFALRFLVARTLAGHAVWDGHYYDFGAHRIAEGHGYSDDRIVGGQLEWHPWCHYPVGYSAYLAAFYWLFGGAPWVVHVADAIAGSLVA